MDENNLPTPPENTAELPFPPAPQAEAADDGDAALPDSPPEERDAAPAPYRADPPPPPGESPAAPPEKGGSRRKWLTRLLFGILMAACVVVLGISLANLIQIQFGYQQAVDEYDRLYEQFYPANLPASTPQPASDDSAAEVPLLPWEVNPDYAAWIEIPNTVLSYPLVRGPDNDKYLNRTFEGVPNAAGAIFMDYRNSTAFDAPHTLIYGHNLKNGRMFGGLHQYLDAGYLQNHPTIIIQTPTATHTYRIFSARVTDMYDGAYRVDFADDADIAAFIAAYGGPEGANRMLTLSTCTNNSDEERLLVHAVLESTSAT